MSIPPPHRGSSGPDSAWDKARREYNFRIQTECAIWRMTTGTIPDVELIRQMHEAAKEANR